jgi:hypothetical protein
MSSKKSCASCENKDINGIFKCEGCSQIFCLKHTNEHRYFLNYQLDEIILEYENNFNTFNENEQQSSLLFDQINQWEKDSIIKIQQTAQDVRIQIQRLAELQKGEINIFTMRKKRFSCYNLEQIKEKFYQIEKELEKARENHEYLEKDLYRWKILLEQFKYDLTILSPSIILHQDQNQPLISKLFLSKINQQSFLNETLTSYSDQIRFDDNHHIAMHCGPYRTPAYISGTQEYSSGQHHIRLFISKKTNEFVLSFNIMSKLMEMSSTLSHSQFLTYGWQTDDCINPSQYCLSNEKKISDLKGKTIFHIDLFIDCDKEKISYFNQKTKRTREINVDVDKCPLPWKLYFYLYDVGDTVRLLSSSPIS